MPKSDNRDKKYPLIVNTLSEYLLGGAPSNIWNLSLRKTSGLIAKATTLKTTSFQLFVKHQSRTTALHDDQHDKNIQWHRRQDNIKAHHRHVRISNPQYNYARC